ncbi:hypothetical protein KP509_28G041600 [Ceratopteris richardii]|uniref:Uncharacterized protein n=1 Tax=Ceratopteris richardii TaxID=49495 RepID=A0A8T2RD45_CERRI|nr:hypothetical protein KP509_28G041600 [Ceratopteris richardii]
MGTQLGRAWRMRDKQIGKHKVIKGGTLITRRGGKTVFTAFKKREYSSKRKNLGAGEDQQEGGQQWESSS